MVATLGPNSTKALPRAGRRWHSTAASAIPHQVALRRMQTPNPFLLSGSSQSLSCSLRRWMKLEAVQQRLPHWGSNPQLFHSILSKQPHRVSMTEMEAFRKA